MAETDLETFRKQFYSNNDDDFLFDTTKPTTPPRRGAGINNTNTRPGPSVVNRAHNTSDEDTSLRGPPDRMAVDTVVPDFLLPKTSEETDLQQLMRQWQNERHAPEILQSQDALLSRILDQIRRQTDDANALRRDANLSEEDHYMIMLVQTEVERVKFIVRSYVRTRLHKIEHYAAYITSRQDIQTRLSQIELQHAQRYAELLVSQFRTAVLDHLPETQQGLDDEVPSMPSMISEPDRERAVFVRAREDCEPVLLPDGTSFQLQRGSIQLMRYRTIEHLLVLGQVDLV